MTWYLKTIKLRKKYPSFKEMTQFSINSQLASPLIRLLWTKLCRIRLQVTKDLQSNVECATLRVLWKVPIDMHSWYDSILRYELLSQILLASISVNLNTTFWYHYHQIYHHHHYHLYHTEFHLCVLKFMVTYLYNYLGATTSFRFL